MFSYGLATCTQNCALAGSPSHGNLWAYVANNFSLSAPIPNLYSHWKWKTVFWVKYWSIREALRCDHLKLIFMGLEKKFLGFEITVHGYCMNEDKSQKQASQLLVFHQTWKIIPLFIYWRVSPGYGSSSLID